MGAGESVPEAPREAPRERPHTLAELGVVQMNDTGVLKERGWVTIPGAPAYVAHRHLGSCQIVAKKSLGIAAERTYYVVRVIDPLFKPGETSPLSNEYYIVPEFTHGETRSRLVHFPSAAIIEFRPNGLAGAAASNGIGAASDGTAAVGYGSEDGYVTVLTRTTERHRVPWHAVQLAVTVRNARDPDLARKLQIINCDLMRTYEGVREFQNALFVLGRHAPDTIPYVSTHFNDADAWGSALHAQASSNAFTPIALTTPSRVSIAAALQARK